MKTITTAAEMTAYSNQIRSKSRSIGFVPTMGALHKGHISLVEHAKQNCDVVIVSVFVNPTQFNNATDLEKYPRTLSKDQELLDTSGVDVLFYPSVKEVYPFRETPSYQLDGLDDFMEGPNRPGHFNGVVQVVSRLFDLVTPNMAVFGEKDFQQLAILKHMTSKLGYDIKVVGCPTLREKSGLAMSSRNQRLSRGGLGIATSIYAVLSSIKSDIKSCESITEAKEIAVQKLAKTLNLKLEYLELVDPDNLRPVSEDAKAVQACIAVWVDGVRLIDNMRVK